MPLLNYTTQISADKTIGEIQRLLVKAGASAILNEYDGQGYITSMSFKMVISDQPISYRLPCDWRPVLSILESDQKVPMRLVSQEQALRVSWRIVKDWVEAQLAIIETRMVKPEQVFLPYTVARDGRTLYELFAENPTLLLVGGTTVIEETE